MPHSAPRQNRSPHFARFATLLSFAVVASCGDEAASPAARSELVVETLVRPTEAFSRLPRFASGATNAPVLSWVEDSVSEGSPRRAELHSASWDGASWTNARRIASGSSWFVNWADFPALSRLDDKRALAQYLERSAAGRYDYSVQLVLSIDSGESWSAPQRLHSHAGPGEHGFVSLVPLADAGWRAVWLDGRQMGGGDHGSHSGAMALYTRTVSTTGELGPETLLDARVCDCCPTAALRAADGAVWIAYRDRGEDELRDISLLRLAPEEGPEERPGERAEVVWSSGDGWKLDGCPVNGPALAAHERKLAVAWFTLGRANTAAVLCALSDDGGATFAEPVQLASGEVLGRVDAVYDSSGALVVSWLDSTSEPAQWRVARIDAQRRVHGPHTLAAASGGRDSGIGRLTASGERVYFAFTESEGEQPRVALRALS
jgi:hypothetical protein